MVFEAGPDPSLERMTWYSAADCRLEDFRALVEQKTELSDYPHALEVRQNVLIYPGDLPDTAEVKSELARALTDGPGIVVFRGAFATEVVDRATEVFFALIAEQKAAGQVGDGLPDLADGAFPDPAALVQDPVDGGRAETGLGGYLPDPVGVLHGVQRDGFFRSFQWSARLFRTLASNA